jgi:hypothetical protein
MHGTRRTSTLSRRCTIPTSSSRTTLPASAPRARTRCAQHIDAIFRNNPTLRFRGRAFYAAGDFAVSEWTATVEKDGKTLEWDGIDVFPFRDGLIARKDVYSSSHRPREV